MSDRPWFGADPDRVVSADPAASLNDGANAVLTDEKFGGIRAGAKFDATVRTNSQQAGSTTAADNQIVIRFDCCRIRAADVVADVQLARSAGIADDGLAKFRAGKATAGTESSGV